MRHLRAFFVVFLIGSICIWSFVRFVGPKYTEAPLASYNETETMEKMGVPNLKIQDLNGVGTDLQSYKGKVVILNFWASWCTPCIEEVPSLLKIINEFKGNVHLIAVSGDSAREDIEVFLKSFPGLKSDSVTIVWDKERSMAKQFNIERLPETLILDKELKLVKKIVGTIDWYTDDSKRYLNQLLSK